jgi:hypothetical protein
MAAPCTKEFTLPVAVEASTEIRITVNIAVVPAEAPQTIPQTPAGSAIVAVEPVAVEPAALAMIPQTPLGDSLGDRRLKLKRKREEHELERKREEFMGHQVMWDHQWDGAWWFQWDR